MNEAGESGFNSETTATRTHSECSFFGSFLIILINFQHQNGVIRTNISIVFVLWCLCVQWNFRWNSWWNLCAAGRALLEAVKDAQPAAPIMRLRRTVPFSNSQLPEADVNSFEDMEHTRNGFCCTWFKFYGSIQALNWYFVISLHIDSGQLHPGT